MYNSHELAKKTRENVSELNNQIKCCRVLRMSSAFIHQYKTQVKSGGRQPLVGPPCGKQATSLA